MEDIPLHDQHFGYELIRTQLLSNILGDDDEKILYWAGKELARSFPQTTLEEVMTFFHTANWGELTLEKNKAHKMTLSLTGDPVTARMHYGGDTINYALEAGFLAQQLETIHEKSTEAHGVMNNHKQLVVFTVMWEDFLD